MEYIELGPTPYDEQCSQVGDDDFAVRSTKEMTVYKNQLNRMFPEVANSQTLAFAIKWFPHDFGTYGEVVVKYIPGNEEEDIVYHIERNLPAYWDNESKKELGLIQ